MSCPSQNSISHVIFDFDGTICNTIECCAIALRKVLRNHGKELTKDYEQQIASSGGLYDIVNFVIKEFKLDSDKNEIRSELREEFQSMKDKYSLMPGVEKLVHHLHKNHIPMAIATGYTHLHFDYVVDKFGDFFKPGKYFDHIVLGMDDAQVKNNKPHPDIFQVCASRFLAAPKCPKDVMVFEDSLRGVQASMAAEMTTIWVVNERYQAVTEDDKKFAHLIINSLQEFKPQLFGLPSF